MFTKLSVTSAIIVGASLAVATVLAIALIVFTVRKFRNSRIPPPKSNPVPVRRRRTERPMSVRSETSGREVYLLASADDLLRDQQIPEIGAGLVKKSAAKG
jgi:hypothetical protein